MDLTQAVDILLDYMYNQNKEMGHISTILEELDYEYNNRNSYILRDKLIQLGLFEMINVSTQAGADFILYPNARGLEFVKEFKTYSNYLDIIKKEKEKQNKLSTQDAKGSFWGGIAGIGSLIISIIVTIYSLYQNNKQDKINEELIKTIEKLNKESESKYNTTRNQAQLHQSMDSLTNLKKK
ncbi:hypothetical protein [Emticicia sp. BO119]|uniref:hypothetical protein n=1 Tax=Emticicia sp. BO119 TaxID=2757768 RepID=UPI0015F0B616|nr:hypothetical protein [Emticicia sp. BO119]MBA4851387.1 hypothetical protein [Emticicia sp. BO119]